jgi:hypothetical protein
VTSTSEQPGFSSASDRLRAGRWPPGLRPEAELLLYAASPPGTKRRSIRFQAPDELALDWEYLLEASLHNETVPLLYSHLNARCPDRVPVTVMSTLRRLFYEISVRNLALTKELTRLLTAFADRGIDAVPFKGPALAQSLYGNLALRRTIDLDILVRKEQISVAAALLFDEGYRLRPEMTPEQQIAHLSSDYHFEFHHPDRRLHVEIHWQVLPKDCGHLITDYLWNHVTPARLAGQPILAFDLEELFVLLCVHHGSKHEWSRLKWIADIGWMIETHRDLDWDRVIRRARSIGHERSVLLGCLIAKSLLGVAIPVEIAPLVRGRPGLLARAALVRGKLFRRERGLPGFREWSAYVDAGDASSALLAMMPARRYLQYLSAVMTPEFDDRYELRLPGWLAFVHYLSRPARLFGRHGSGLFGRLN